jgi:hypothetical protein
MCINCSRLNESQLEVINNFNFNFNKNDSLLYIVKCVFISGNIKAIKECIKLCSSSFMYHNYDMSEDIQEYIPVDNQEEILKFYIKEYGNYINIEDINLYKLKIIQLECPEYFTYDNVIRIIEEYNDNSDILDFIYDYYKQNNKLLELLDLLITIKDINIEYVYNKIRNNLKLE